MNYSNINFNLPNDWLEYIDSKILNEVFKNLANEIKNNCNSEFYPYNKNDIFKIFHLCKLSNIKVVILGQDPYYSSKSQANGIAFSVNQGVKIPPSLKNIYKEAKINSTDGDLSKWVQQGVFLLNSSLTVKQNYPNSHNYIWKDFITHILQIINDNCKDVIFVAWGNFALERYKKIQNINFNKHIFLSCSHPSPLSCYKKSKESIPFIGSMIFDKINDILKQKSINTIKW